MLNCVGSTQHGISQTVLVPWMGNIYTCKNLKIKARNSSTTKDVRRAGGDLRLKLQVHLC